MTRISTGIFRFDKYLVRYDRKTCYIGCDCNMFTAEGKCEHTIVAEDLLVSEGLVVKYHKVIRPTFIDDIPFFQQHIMATLKDCDKLFAERFSK